MDEEPPKEEKLNLETLFKVVPLDPFIVERACSIIKNLEPATEGGRKIKALQVLQDHLAANF